ncbi:DUF6660 family protein [Pedobacter gandavensis]|uniref:DUF6660 family protein n=1 Tax=Pedobacter gandavensis TaxID=2679963 RepID=UPI0039775A68
MKIVNWLIVIIILVMNFVPCKDMNNSRASVTNRISKTIADDNHSKSDLDSCSPFCSCSCCNTPIPINQVVHIKTISLILKKEYVDLYSANAASVSLSIWQPPQLS